MSVFLQRVIPNWALLILFLDNGHLLWISPFDRKDDRGLRFWLDKPAVDWMQHIDLKERIIIWVAFDFPDLPHPEFGLLNIPRNGRTGFRLSGAPPIRAGRPGAPSRLSDRSLGPRLCAARRSLPAGEILPVAHTNGSALRLVQHRRCHTMEQQLKCVFFFFGATFIHLYAGCCFQCSPHTAACASLSVQGLWPACVLEHKADLFLHKREALCFK